jgi:hypothetical protein
MMSDQEPDGEYSYANCLLTVLAKSPIVAVTLNPGRGVPPLAPFAAADEEREWIARLPFRYERLDAGKVIALVLALAGYRFYHLRGRSYTLIAKLAGPDGLHPVRFSVRRGGGLPSGPIAVAKIE